MYKQDIYKNWFYDQIDVPLCSCIDCYKRSSHYVMRVVEFEGMRTVPRVYLCLSHTNNIRISNAEQEACYDNDSNTIN